ncbi:MAG TPA: ATP-binding cassette domain-containing protein [Cyclobacteriaceae bacterium]
MLNTDQILRILQESGLLYQHDMSMAELRGRELSNREYAPNELDEFKRDLIETGNIVRLLLLEYSLNADQYKRFVSELEFPILLFRNVETGLSPEIVFKKKKKLFRLTFTEEQTHESEFDLQELQGLVNEQNEVTFMAITEYDHLVSDSENDDDPDAAKPSPVKRLIKLLRAEKKDIYYVFFYAILVGIISLVIPLGIQTTTELISGGVFFSSIYLLIGLIILGVLVTGVLQIFQLTMVEYLQRRIFTKAAYEFAFRLPRVKNEALSGKYAPELVNRFFDVLTLQKGLPKLLIDLSSATIQIVFGLLLISLYHPFFVFFGIVLMFTLVSIFYFTGPKGLRTSIEESKYKYKVVYWLQELGRALNSFKVSGNSNLPIRKTDFNLNNYLKFRKSHFRVLVTQYSYIVMFKTGITAALLILGAMLVIQREITLGQFVASEVVIILILNSVEKVITYMDVVYDMLTAVDKIAHVTDLPLEKSGGVDFRKSMNKLPISVDVKNLNYKYPDSKSYMLKDINMSVLPGQRVCITGPGGSGKTTLTQLISGLHSDFEGSITINKYSIRDLDLTNLRDHLAKNISMEDIFDGSVLENITVGKTYLTVQDAIVALEKTGIYDWVNGLPDGLNTNLVSGGKGLPRSMVLKLILARCIAKKPSLIVLNDYFSSLSNKDKTRLIRMLSAPENNWSLIAVSNDPLIMEACDKVIVLDKGRIIGDGTFQELQEKNMLAEFIA